MNAQVKAAFDVVLAMRRNDVFEIERANAREALQDEIQETVYLFMDQILAKHAEGDDLEIGRIIGNCISNYALHIERSRQAQELREAFLPNWRAKVEP
jgi:hypothetical protein